MGTYTWLIGASGAVAGVMGAYIVLYPHARVYVLLGLTIPIPLPLPALWMLGAWAAVQLFYLIFGDASPVAWSAHVRWLDRRRGALRAAQTPRRAAVRRSLNLGPCKLSLAKASRGGRLLAQPVRLLFTVRPKPPFTSR